MKRCERNGNKRRIEMDHVWVHMPYDECDLYVYLKCASNSFLKRPALERPKWQRRDKQQNRAPWGPEIKTPGKQLDEEKKEK